jgi:ABC-type polysaccharide/polyol phosphate transport system ATPase subunit
VIFVNHSNAVISRVSTDILYMKDGQQVYSGNNASHGIELYQAQFKGETS